MAADIGAKLRRLEARVGALAVSPASLVAKLERGVPVDELSSVEVELLIEAAQAGLASIDDAALHQERERRAAARHSLLAFTSYTFPGYQVAPHHESIAAALEAVERGEIRRLAIMMPPRHGKRSWSACASRRGTWVAIPRGASSPVAIAPSYRSASAARRATSWPRRPTSRSSAASRA